MYARQRHYQDLAEGRPDQFILYDYVDRLDESREAIAGVVKAPVEAVVFVGNATDGVNTVLRNLQWNADGKDTIIYFSTGYEACINAVEYLCDYFGRDKLSSKGIPLSYPLEDDEIVQKFRDAVTEIQAQGKRARLAMYDVVSSRPGVVFPWVKLTAVCKELGIQTLIDGAQGVGMVKLDLAKTDPDFFVSNVHKWCFAPRGCAVLYVPVRNQHLLPTTLATSHGYVSKAPGKEAGPLPVSDKSQFEANFGFVGSRDSSAYYAVKDAVAWRRDVCGGEDRIMEYIWDLNKRGIKRVAETLGTEFLENKAGTLTNCAMGNVALPVWVESAGRQGDVVVPRQDAGKAFQWMKKVMWKDYNLLLPLFFIGDRYWARMSAQIYLDEKDYDRGAEVLNLICQRVRNGEYKE